MYMTTERLKTVAPEIARRIRVEQRIVRLVVKLALAAGWTLSVDTGGDEYDLEDSTKFGEVLKAMMEVDDEKLRLRRGKETGWIWFVYGNGGWDVISDYSTNLDGLLEPVMRLSDRLEAGAAR